MQTWHNFELLLDYASDTYSIFYDGALQLSGIGFSEGLGEVNTFSDAPITTVGAAGDVISQAAIGSAFFDNYVITAIPEPTPVIVWSLLTSIAVGSYWVRAGVHNSIWRRLAATVVQNWRGGRCAVRGLGRARATSNRALSDVRRYGSRLSQELAVT